MPIRPRNMALPRLRTIRYRVSYSAFTDGGGAAGTFQFPDTFETKIPIGAYVLGTRCILHAGFAGDTSATITIGDGSDVDRYNTGTPDVFTTQATAGIDMGVPSGTKMHTSAIRPTLTITSGSDWGLVTAGNIEIEIGFLEFFA